jgi:hypothetical protein
VDFFVGVGCFEGPVCGAAFPFTEGGLVGDLGQGDGGGEGGAGEIVCRWRKTSDLLSGAPVKKGLIAELRGWVVSRAQYPSIVSAITLLFHLMTRCLGVRSSRGGRGKLWTFNLVFGGMMSIY